MVKLTRKDFRIFIILLTLIASAIGMIVMKQKIELGDYNEELYDMQFLFFNVTFSLTIAYVILNFLFNKWKEYRQLKNEHSKAQLELLKSKIDPHFFFNTLNNLYGLAIRKSDETGPVILKLSEIMRYTIYKGEQETVSLREEIAYLKQYIEIHKIRYQKKVEISFEDTLEEKEFMIAPLLFINLVENAFKHGIEGLTDDAVVNIKLTASGEEVNFEIQNNFEKSPKTEGGHGLKNLRQRLALLYPKKHKLSLQEAEGLFTAQLTINLA